MLVSDLFYYTGSSQYFVVPPGHNIMTVTAYGSVGGYSYECGSYGGNGGSITASYSVIPGETYLVCVGGSGGDFDGGSGTYYGGSGGGSTDIFLVGNCSRIIVAGGGGGAGCYSYGGDGGYLSNVGDTPSSAGSGDYYYGGGGGGGYVGGGGGGYYYGGSGGTSYTSGALIDSEVGINTGNGQARVTFSHSGNVEEAVPMPDKPCIFTPHCYFAPPTPQPSGI